MSAGAEEFAIRTVDLAKDYDGGMVHALRGVSVGFARGEFVAVMGPSGSGKSTFLNLVGTLDEPSSGCVYLLGEDVSKLPRLHEVRRRRLGFVFQLHNLIPNLSLLENVQVPLYGMGLPRAERRRRAADILERVGLAPRQGHLATRVSGGERQRAAIARALVNDPPIVLADEPTGNLDTENGRQVLAALTDVQTSRERLLVVVTHNPEVASRADRVLEFLDGRVVNETRGSLR